MYEFISDFLSVSITLLMLFILFHNRIRQSAIWHATVTPLASIIGSGFLIAAPLLLVISGVWALPLMLILVSIAYGLGSALRYNIKNVEPLIKTKTATLLIRNLEEIARPALGLAYIISVTFYLKLLSVFVLRGIGYENFYAENGLTTVLLLLIGITGKIRGLKMLETYEIYSVNTKLSIIIAALTCYLVYNIHLVTQSQWGVHIQPTGTIWMNFRKYLGLLLVIQGFETSRYLGYEYDIKTRVRTMRYAQMISGAIYLLFVILAAAVFKKIQIIDELLIINLSKVVAITLPALLIIAAVMSQFSAAVADTIGSGSLLSESVRQKISVKNSYFIITLVAIVLTWATDVFNIIVIASKAFAFYYAVELIIAIVASIKNSQRNMFRLFLFVSLFLLMLMVVIFGIPVE